MGMLHLPDNIKIHFAGAEHIHDAQLLHEMGITHCLYTAFPFIEKKLFKNISEISVPKYLCANMKHVIQDSGLFSMLFGKYKDIVTKELVFKWYDNLIEWTLEHEADVTCVEVDAQSIIGTDETWTLREKMRHDLPNHRIINVWHLPDGKYGLDRMIEFSDYIAIGLPELRYYGCDEYALPLVKYIKRKKPSIDIHLLGFTNFTYLKKFRFCTSCDSITWLSARRFGTVGGTYKPSEIDTEKVKNYIGEEKYIAIKRGGSEIVANAMCVNLEWWKHVTTKICGDQNFEWMHFNSL